MEEESKKRDVASLLLTTSRRTKPDIAAFVKHMARVVPYATRVQRGKSGLKELAAEMERRGTDKLIIVQNHKGNPGKLVFCELSEGMLRFRAVATIRGVVLPKGNGKEECSSLRVELDEELKEDPHALNLHSLIQEYFVEDMFHPVAGGPCILRIQKDDGLLILIFIDRGTGRTLPLSVKISSVELLEQ